MKCRGCGKSNLEPMITGGPGPMHPECEIKRLNELLDEERELHQMNLRKLGIKLDNREAELTRLRELDDSSMVTVDANDRADQIAELFKLHARKAYS